MNTIHLHGYLSQFGTGFELSINSVGEAVRAIGVQISGFLDALKDGEYRVILGSLETDINDSNHLTEDELGMAFNGQDIHIVPHVAGSGNAGLNKLLVGLVIVGASFLIPGVGSGLAAAWASGAGIAGIGAIGVTYGTIGLIGVGLALGGLAMLIAPTPQAPDPNDSESTPSNFTFTGPVNLSEQGHVIPPVYGKFRMGTITVSAEMETQSIQAGYWQYRNTGGVFGGGLDRLLGPTWVAYDDNTAYSNGYDAYALQSAQFPNWPSTAQLI